MFVAAQLFLAFQCESFGYDDFAVPPKSKAYLQASLDVECFPRDESDRRHAAIMAWTYPFIVLWPVAMPLLYVLLLHRCRHAILQHRPTTLSRATRFLWNGYEDAYYWYEIFELYKKLTLTSFLLFINSKKWWQPQAAASCHWADGITGWSDAAVYVQAFPKGQR